MNKTMQNLFVGLTLLLISYCDGFIVPQEVSSLLSVVYSNIPPIKKGTDSRIGFGFRLGEHADFQTLIELGPQKYTKPLGPKDDSDGSDTSKRMVKQSEYNKLIKPTHEKKDQWIQNWAKEMKNKTANHNRQKPQKTENDSFKALFGPKDQYAIPTASVINPFALKQLQQLHGKRNEQSTETVNHAVGTLPSNSMEAHVLAAVKLKRQQQIRSELMDVSLDD